MQNWLTDITTLTGVESLFHQGKGDPWAVDLAGKVADWYAYSSTPTFILPQPSARPAGLNAPPVPKIVEVLRQRESSAMKPLVCLTDTQITLVDELYLETVAGFLSWCKANPNRLQDWLKVHSEPWVTGGHAERIPHRYLYDVQKVFSNPDFIHCAAELNISQDNLGYTLDVALRYARYGELVGEKCFYLSHPLREQQRLPTMSLEPQSSPPIALSFAASVSRLAHSLTLDGYSSLLYEIRSVVSQRSLRALKPDSIEKKEIRNLAAELNLPVHLKGWAKTAGLAAGALGGFAALPTIATGATVAGAVVSVGPIFWDGSVPRSIGKFKWLRWALEWQIEDEAK